MIIFMDGFIICLLDIDIDSIEKAIIDVRLICQLKEKDFAWANQYMQHLTY